jgi:hypothetical protein
VFVSSCIVVRVYFLGRACTDGRIRGFCEGGPPSARVIKYFTRMSVWLSFGYLCKGVPKWGKQACMECVPVQRTIMHPCATMFLIVAHVCTTVERTSTLGCAPNDVTGAHGCSPLFPTGTHECVNVG